MNAIAKAHHYQQASFSLKEILQDLSFEDVKQRFPEAIQRYRKSIRKMPKVLRQNPYIKRALMEIEHLELDARNYMSEWYESSPSQKAAWELIERKAQEASDLISELEQSPYLQKFLRGETVLSTKKNLQWRRKIVHAALGVSSLFLVIYSGLPKWLIWSVMGSFLVWAFSLETARHLNPKVNQWVLRKFAPIMREGEEHKINSSMFYIVSIAFVYFFFPQNVLVMTLLFLAIGDPFAGIIGVRFGSTKITPHATLEGSLACFGACASIAFLCVPVLFHQHNHSWLGLITFSTLAGIVGAVAESSFKKLDDNLVMPLISAPGLWILMKIFSII